MMKKMRRRERHDEVEVVAGAVVSGS
jgi:hypothetical protein